MLAHIAGAPVEETALSLGPAAFAAAVLAGARLRVRRLSAGQLADLREAIVLAQGTRDDRGYQYWAGIHGLPLPELGEVEAVLANRDYFSRLRLLTYA